uniref:Deoxynucleotidyltransferase termina-interacting protein 1 n=1 Tax=virus sp. ctML55 TaxID=2827627 RepID=A0A8S5RJ27_9VIRU|nr:MAG TPA: deoxynucleotidyltransferase termina-interacting protein 1 [virus sp. ctML55]DAW91992.1 MAG TPA: deoxynucleotidyltransferase termina-interacting protein 1 [Bacteriophage sp.]
MFESCNALYFLQASLNIGSLNSDSVNPESLIASSCRSCSEY